MKILGLKIITIAILIWIYAVAILGFVEIFTEPLNLEIPSIYFAVLLSIIGVCLGFLFSYISLQKSIYKSYIALAITMFFTILLFGDFLVFGSKAFLELLIKTVVYVGRILHQKN